MKPRAGSPKPTRTRRWTSYAVGSYALLIAAVAGVMYGWGDRTWWGTVVLFGPRWVWGIPWFAFALAALRWGRRRELLIISVAGLVWLVAVWGWVFPWGRVFAARSGEPPLRILTYNLCNEQVNLVALERLLRDADPDLAAFQEASEDLEKYLPPGWTAIRSGKVVVASRHPLRPVVGDRQMYGWGQGWWIANLVQVETSHGPLLFAGVHFDSPRVGLMQLLDRFKLVAPERRTYLEYLLNTRRSQQRRVRAQIEAVRGSLPRIVAGDFNTPVESTIYREVWGDLSNAFSLAGWGPGETIEVEIRGFVYGARIDQILSDPDWRCVQAWVGPDLGSDHRPLLADLLPSHP